MSEAEFVTELIDSLWNLSVTDVERLDRPGWVRVRLAARGTDDADVDVFFHELDVRRPS